MSEFLTPNKLLAAAAVIICSLIGVVWSINNNRIQQLENAHIERDLALYKQAIAALDGRIQKIEQEVERLKERR